MKLLERFLGILVGLGVVRNVLLSAEARTSLPRVESSFDLEGEPQKIRVLLKVGTSLKLVNREPFKTVSFTDI